MEAYSTSYDPTSKSHSNLLHSVRKSQSKPWKKAPVMPQPLNAIKVYEVDVMNFRELVQQLTGAPEFKPQQQKIVSASQQNQVSSNWNKGVQSQENSGVTNQS
ncbi:hypothetical protein L195_g043525, partial [Trifolium pratense]